MAFGVVEHHVARAVAVLPTEELSREREQLGLVGRDEQHLLRAPHEEVEVRTLREVEHERKTAAAAHARLSLDGPPSRARNGRTLGYPGMREVLPRSPYHPGGVQAGSTATVTFARTSGSSRISTACGPSERSGSGTWIFARSTDTPCSRWSASAMSLFVTDPKVLPCPPAFRRKTSVSVERRAASCSASACARSFFTLLASCSCARCFSSPAVASIASPRGRRKFCA